MSIDYFGILPINGSIMRLLAGKDIRAYEAVLVRCKRALSDADRLHGQRTTDHQPDPVANEKPA